MMSTAKKHPVPKLPEDLKRDRFLKPYMEVIAAAGAATVLFSLAHVRLLELGLPFLLLVVVTVSLGSRIVVRFFRFDSCISISDIFVFLALLLFDGEAAVLLAGLEGYFSSLRITKRPLTMAFNSASMALSTFLTVWTLRYFFGPILELSSGGFSPKLITATCTMAFVQYIVNSGVVAVAGALK